MMHPLIQRLYDDFGYPEVTLETHQDFVSQPGITVLFFAGDPNRFRDTTDVAVVLPELVKAFEGTLRPGSPPGRRWCFCATAAISATSPGFRTGPIICTTSAN